MKEREVVFQRRGWPTLRAAVGPAIAQGGTSFIHSARLLEPQAGAPESFVVKRAKPGTERFLERERASCARFDHPHLVSYLGSAQDEILGPLLALERLAPNPLLLSQRKDLRPAFRDPGAPYYPLPPGVALELAYDLLIALEHLHSHGCVHADVKLANFMVRTRGPADPRSVLAGVARGDFEGVLIDLGSVRSLETLRRAGKGEETQDAVPPITPIYAPPEAVLDGNGIVQRVSPSMDSYAFALCFYALLTGRSPYHDIVKAEEARHPWVLAELKTRELRREIVPIDERALDDLPLHDVAFADGIRNGWPAFRSGVAWLLRRCTDPDPSARLDVAAARAFFEQEFGRGADASSTRAWRQGIFDMLPHSNRLTGDAPVGQIRVGGPAEGAVDEPVRVSEDDEDAGHQLVEPSVTRRTPPPPVAPRRERAESVPRLRDSLKPRISPDEWRELETRRRVREECRIREHQARTAPPEENAVQAAPDNTGLLDVCPSAPDPFSYASEVRPVRDEHSTEGPGGTSSVLLADLAPSPPSAPPVERVAHPPAAAPAPPRAPVPQPIQVVLAALRASSDYADLGPFALVTTGSTTPDILASRVYELRAWLGDGGPRRIRIGRGPGNAIALSDRSLSRQHVEIERSPDGELWVTDLGSSNGTVVGGARITKKRRVRIPSGAPSVALGPNSTVTFADARELAGLLEATLQSTRVSDGSSSDSLFSPARGVSRARTTQVSRRKRCAG